MATRKVTLWLPTGGLCCAKRVMAEMLLSQTDLFYGLYHRYAERGEAV
ncbi:hypothetical protein FHS00_003454 [Limimaricola variabilis]|uniref:Uncharacterized protein n=1 Tax=Limimaricola variabilis TaxID=1492771 RepID=A0ABR6HTP6_9RHOB|nr:hypothetical protein [Limimaricola variabilis]